MGRQACTSVCSHAIYEIITKGKIESTHQLLAIIGNGIKTHIHGEKPGTIPGPKNFIEDVLPDLNAALENAKMKISAKDMTSDDNVYSFKDADFVIVTAGQKEEGGRMESILLFRQNDKFCVFDSHGTSFEGIPRGASVRQFDSSEGLQEYIEGKYPEESHHMSAISLKKEDLNQ